MMKIQSRKIWYYRITLIILLFRYAARMGAASRRP